MPKVVAAQVAHLQRGQIRCAVPTAMAEAPVVYRLDDGALIMEAVPLIAEQDMLYYGYEVPMDELFGEGHGLEWDTPLTGRLTQECAEFLLDQFEGLPITDDHVFIEPGEREEYAVGVFLRDAVLDGDKVRSRALIYASSAVMRVDAQGSELSIGGLAFMEVNPDRGQPDQPDFFIIRINLNHVAMVKRGRAGADARLLNHRATLSNSQSEIPHMLVTINGVEIEVPDAAVTHYSTQLTAANQQLATVTNSVAELTTQVTAVTAERDSAQGALTAAQAELTAAQERVTALENNAPDVTAAAAALATEHAAFATAAATLGHSEPLTLGGYDRTTVMRAVLNARGAQFAEDANADTLNGAWQFALANAEGVGRSALDGGVHVSNTAALSVADGATSAVNTSYFGGKKGS